MERQIVRVENSRESVTYRRKLVGQLWLRGLRAEEIAEALGRNGLRAQGSSDEYGVEIVEADILALEAGWLEEMRVANTNLKARCWAELREVKRKAWQDGNLGVVLRVLKQEESMLRASEMVDAGQVVGGTPEHPRRRIVEVSPDAVDARYLP